MGFMGMRYLVTAIAVCRNYSTNGRSNVFEKGYKSKAKYKKYPRNPIPRIKWTDEQKKVLDCISRGCSVFITGSAGTGKSVLLKNVIHRLRKQHGKNAVFVTAPTGVAACALKGQTLHSFAGIGYTTRDREIMLDWILGDRRAYRRWIMAEVLVIDEISMVDADFFENLEYISRKVRQCDKVWGGLKLVASGDFFQLPPINPQNSSGKEFAFESDCWDSSFDVQIELTEVFRQSEPRLIKLLQDIRKGQLDPDDLELLEKSCSVIQPNPSAIQLYPRIDDVNRANEEKIKALSKRKTVYRASDTGNDALKRQLSKGLAPDKLVLCEGARVMLIKNLNVWHGLVNGSTGTVTRFEVADGATHLTCDNVLPVVKFDSGKEILIEPETWSIMEGGSLLASREQLPLVLAWAISIHKCQGLTLDNIHTDLSRAFGCGMVYVALSRVRKLENLHISGFCPKRIKAHHKVLQFNKHFAQEQDKQVKDECWSQPEKDSSSSTHAIPDKTTIGLEERRHEFSLKEFLSSRLRGFSLKKFLGSRFQAK
ncbi:hypothetical protein SLE2022_213070 [Rubroshorea leprosula]